MMRIMGHISHQLSNPSLAGRPRPLAPVSSSPQAITLYLSRVFVFAQPTALFYLRNPALHQPPWSRHSPCDGCHVRVSMASGPLKRKPGCIS